MAELEKVIKEWEAVLSRDPLDAPWDLIDDTLALLKEQEDLGTELGNAVELIHKKNERIEQLNRFVNGFSRDAIPVVRCKDCKHSEKANDVYLCGKPRGFGLAHEPNWFCADGERKESR